MNALVISVGGERHGIPLAALRAVVPAPPITPLPHAPAAVMGLTGVQGEIVPVLDTAVLLGAPPLVTAPYVAVVETARGPAGLATTGEPATGDAPALDLDALFERL